MKNQAFPKNYFNKSHIPNIPLREELEKNFAFGYRKDFVNFIKAIPQNARILDAGCGVGKFIKVILSYRPDVEIYAIDISNVKEFLPEKIKFQKASTEEIGKIYEENFFDAIICLHVLEHLLYPMETMKNFKKVLKPEGKFYLETPNWSRALIFFSDIFFWNDYTHVRIFTKLTIKRLFDDYGFNITELKSISSRSVKVRGDSMRKVKSVYIKEGRNFFRFLKKLLATAFSRIINPFLKDVLICVAVNKK